MRMPYGFSDSPYTALARYFLALALDLFHFTDVAHGAMKRIEDAWTTRVDSSALRQSAQFHFPFGFPVSPKIKLIIDNGQWRRFPFRESTLSDAPLRPKYGSRL